MTITTARQQGTRSYQEDRWVVHRGEVGALLAVIDGHGGSRTADYIAKNLASLGKELGYANFTEVFARLAAETQHNGDGAAVSVVFLPSYPTPLVAFVAILGDSPVVIRNAKGEINISPEHNVRTNLAEREAAEGRGGIYRDGYLWDQMMDDGLQMSRALGDAKLSRILNREPEVYAVPLGDKSFVLLATDGMLDPSHQNPDVEAVVRLVDNGKTAEELVQHSIDRDGTDNSTCILVRM